MLHQEGDISIYVLGHGWHTGIVVPRAHIPDHLWPAHRELPESKYVEVGWGDKAYYQAEKATIWVALQAALVPTPSVLHLVWFDLPVTQYFVASDIIEVRLSSQDFNNLCAFIGAAYKRDEHGKTIHLGPGLYGNSAFYLATGSYHLFNTCNNWIAKALRAAGCPISPGQAMTAGNVLAQTRRFGQVLR
jgi:uncharacterized protein (TIGR02117 family)